MPYSSLLDFFGVQNFLIKTAFGRVKNNAGLQRNLHTTCRMLREPFGMVKNGMHILHFPLFSRVKNIWVKTALGQSQEYQHSQEKPLLLILAYQLHTPVAF